jgi:hypothetical protein
MLIIVLPSDVLIIVMHNLTMGQLAALAKTCQFFNALVSSTVILFEHLADIFTTGARVWMAKLFTCKLSPFSQLVRRALILGRLHAGAI